MIEKLKIGSALLVECAHSTLLVDKINDIVASKINLLTILLKRGFPKRRSSQRAPELRFSSSTPGII